jgi:hypothetical protein
MASSEQMSKRDRVEATLARQPTDRVPVYDMPLNSSYLALDAPGMISEFIEICTDRAVRVVHAIADRSLTPCTFVAGDIAMKGRLLHSPAWLRAEFFPRLRRPRGHTLAVNRSGCRAGDACYGLGVGRQGRPDHGQAVAPRVRTLTVLRLRGEMRDRLHHEEHEGTRRMDFDEPSNRAIG